MTRPACFDSDVQYEEWRRWAQLAQVNPRKAPDTRPNFCQDCTACFKRKMEAEGRCEYPLTQFTRVQEPEAGTMPVGHEIVGYEGEKPTAGDYLLSKVRRPAGARGSRPVSLHIRPARDGSQPPSPAPAELSADLSATALEELSTMLSAPPAEEPGTEPVPSQS